jgi:hypothetical protein
VLCKEVQVNHPGCVLHHLVNPPAQVWEMLEYGDRGVIINANKKVNLTVVHLCQKTRPSHADLVVKLVHPRPFLAALAQWRASPPSLLFTTHLQCLTLSARSCSVITVRPLNLWVVASEQTPTMRVTFGKLQVYHITEWWMKFGGIYHTLEFAHAVHTKTTVLYTGPRHSHTRTSQDCHSAAFLLRV